MPKIPKHPCRHVGCGKLVEYGKAYCSEHQPAAEEHKRDATRVYDDKRRETRFYHGTRWQKLRRTFLARHPLCEVCLRANRIESAKIVDHIKEIADGGARYDADNLQALCQSCHNKKTATEKKVRNNQKKTKQAPGGG